MKGADAAAEMKATAQISAEVEWARCECCGLSEECTPAYISKERHLGRWICGLCAEAVKDEIGRSGWPISTAEAIDRHASFFRAFRAVAPPTTPPSTSSPPSPAFSAAASTPRAPTTTAAAPCRRTTARFSPALEAASPLSKAE